MKMLLVDSLYVNGGGGKVLLDYLVDKIESERINCVYLFDKRCKSDYKFIPKERKLFLKASLVHRHRYYIKNKLKFSKVLCFANLPPTLKLNIPVITYFHQSLFLDVPKSFSLYNKMMIRLKTTVLNSIKLNSNLWLVQSDIVRTRLSAKYGLDLNNIRLMPFYPPIENGIVVNVRKSDGFVYVSNGGQYKNHEKLIEAFCDFFDENKKGLLHITISEKFPEIIKLLKKEKYQFYPIINHGFLERNDLVEIYKSNKYSIFPSLAESFALGLIEAMENGCKIIGADLPYTYAVCNPSIVFDPLNVKDTKRALVESQMDNVKETEQLVFNQIDELIALLKE